MKSPLRPIPAVPYLRRATILAMVLLAMGSCSSNSAPKARTFVYGDSILFEARNELKSSLTPQVRPSVTVRAAPSLAPCDWLPILRRDLARSHPNLVVLETVGVSTTPCMRDASGAQLREGTAEYFRRYSSTVDLFVATAVTAHASVVMIAPLPVGGYASVLQPTITKLATILQAVAKRRGVDYTTTPSDSVTSAGAFTWRLPCRPNETTTQGCRNGNITVREPLGVHFCPTGYSGMAEIRNGCRIYSSGSLRYATAIATLIEQQPTAPKRR